jgi:hypothetical protein
MTLKKKIKKKKKSTKKRKIGGKTITKKTPKVPESVQVYFESQYQEEDEYIYDPWDDSYEDSIF